jgi:hypothetical protein
MRLAAIVLAIFETVLASSEAAAITTYSSSPFRHMIATARPRSERPFIFQYPGRNAGVWQD